MLDFNPKALELGKTSNNRAEKQVEKSTRLQRLRSPLSAFQGRFCNLEDIITHITPLRTPNFIRRYKGSANLSFGVRLPLAKTPCAKTPHTAFWRTKE